MRPSVDERPRTLAAARVAGRAPLAVVAALTAAFVLARLASFGWDPSAFVVAGDGITNPADAPPNVGFNRGVAGYDGQAYYRLSRDPLTSEVTEHGMTWKRPAYWQARIGYPAVVWTLSLGGQEALVPTTMLLVNVLALLALAAVAVTLARDAGRSTWFALVPALFGGYLVGISQDLSEPLQGALLLAAVLALRRRRWAWAALALTAAALTRETSLVLVLAVIVVAAIGRFRWRPAAADHAIPWWVGTLPLAVYVCWRSWVRSRWTDVVPAPPGDNILTWPFWGLLHDVGVGLTDLASHGGNLVLVALSVTTVGLLASALADRDAGLRHERIALAGYLLLLACLPIWDRNQAYLRWCCEPVLLGSTVLLGVRETHRRIVVLGVATALLWTAAALATVRYPGTERWSPTAADIDRRLEQPCSL